MYNENGDRVPYLPNYNKSECIRYEELVANMPNGGRKKNKKSRKNIKRIRSKRIRSKRVIK